MRIALVRGSGEATNGKRELLVSKTWLQAAALVVLVGFGLLVIFAGAGLNQGAADLTVLGAALLLSGMAGVYLFADFRSTPADPPWSRS